MHELKPVEGRRKNIQLIGAGASDLLGNEQSAWAKLSSKRSAAESCELIKTHHAGEISHVIKLDGKLGHEHGKLLRVHVHAG